MNETRAFWTSDIWDFDDGYFSKKFFWSSSIVEFFDKEINRERIKALFKEIRPFICNIFEPEVINLLYGEINHSLDTGVFCDRKAEFLKKINSPSENYLYWDTTF